MNDTFKSLGLPDAIIKGLIRQGIESPTPIQQQAILAMLSGQDVLGQSETGSGKTLAYLCPVFAAVDSQKRQAQAIILTPTHELAAQVYKQAELLEKNSRLGVKCALIIGSASMTRQMEKLKEKPHIIIGSYGRILDLIQKKKINAQGVKTIVIDEADRMLDEKNRDGVQAVIKTTLRDRRLALFSASFSDETIAYIKSLCKPDLVILRSGQTGKMPVSISHMYIVADRREKFIVLRKLLAGEKPQKAIVFINNTENIEVIVDKLNHHGIAADGIYGGAYKTKRQNAIEDFRQGRIHVLVASEIGARGLDVSGVTHIINLDIPEEPVFYLHRAGRCGRQGQAGRAISIVTPNECRLIHKYEKAWSILFTEMEMSYGSLVAVKKEKKTLSSTKKTSRQPADTKEVKGFFAKKALRQAEKQKKSKK